MGGRAGALGGKVAVVTGAASGIGRATAVRFAAEGARLGLLDIDVEGLYGVTEEVRKLTEVLAVEADVTDAASVERACKQITDRFDAVDIVVNSAGVELTGTIFDTTADTWNLTLAVNVTGSFLVSQAFARGMKTRGSGSIVNVGSTASALAIANSLAYCASKGAIAQLTRSIAIEGAPFGIRANCVHPGATDTPMENAGATRAGISVEEFHAMEARKYPMRRIAKAEEVAAAILFLASDEASFVTGAQLSVDGGRTAESHS